MRRIPRIRRPSGLTSTTNVRSTTGPSKINQYPQASAPFTSSSTQSNPTSLKNQSQRSIARPLYPSSINRFYSSDKPKPTPTLATEQEQEPGKELQFKARVADGIVDAETANEDLEWTEEGFIITSEGPYTTPPPRVDAAREDEVGDPTYVPATSADGLETVGGLKNWWNQRENWGPGGDFTSFRPKQKVTDPALIEAAVRRAVIEALALREVGRDDDLVGVWPTTASKADIEGLLSWNVKSVESGEVSLGGDASTVAEGLQWKDEESDEHEHSALPEALTPEEAAALSKTWDPSWKTISIADPRIRFAVTKRIFQLTGQLIPDHQLPSITTVQTLLHTLKKPPKPATLTQEIQKRQQELLELPNVTIATKRVTKGDKEKALGRFKLMQEEFKKRDLPVLGHGYARKGKELSRLRGGV
ncbi:ribosomal subunit 39S-domain-containing protein [Xylariaceae sp. AK1471]|nr:ribosomal subunit 39S-domain-containing protein [Xylariaceae sp. AK1471]